MESRLIDITPVSLSVWVYRILLRTYPVRFQQEYGSDMVQVFQDGCTRSIQRMGMAGIINYWMLTLLDFLVSVISEHSQRDAEMTKSKSIKLTGMVLMLGGFMLFVATWSSDSFWNFLFSLGLKRDNHFVHPALSWLGHLAMLIGLTLIYRQMPSNLSSMGKSLFGATAIGIVMAMIFTFTLVIPNLDFSAAYVIPMMFLMVFGGLGVAVFSAMKPSVDNQAD